MLGMTNRKSALWFGRAAIAAVWAYHGLWNKLLGGSVGHAAIVASIPGLGAHGSQVALKVIGAFEVVLAIWVMSGSRARWAAMTQTFALIGMNAAGLIWARELIPDPGAMIVQNIALLALIGMVSEGGTRSA